MNTSDPSTTSDALAAQLDRLYGRINYERQIKVSPDGFRLETMRELLRRLDNPHLAYPVIHVAGTKGKGSVSTMCGSVLTAAGHRTGVYTSPHLETIHQRMAIDGRLISDEQLLEILQTIQPLVAAMDAEADPETDPTLTFFEITTAAAMVFFAQQKVDYVVLEVGLGGRMDSTNVCQPAVCVITNISFDHTKQLGKTIDRIAREKAGIIKPGIPVVSGALDPAAASAIAEVAKQQNAPLVQLDRDFCVNTQPKVKYEPATRVSESSPSPRSTARDVPKFSIQGKLGERSIDLSDLEVGLAGAHQRTNAALAVAAVSLLNHDIDAPSFPAAAIQKGLKETRLSGRMEVVRQRPLVILDIAHNPASAAALAETLATETPQWSAADRRVLIFATSRDKDAARMLAKLTPLFTEVWLTEYQTNPRAYPMSKLVSVAGSLPNLPNACQRKQFEAATPRDAWAAASRTLGPQDAVCVAGSAFLIAELRPAVLEWANSH